MHVACCLVHVGCPCGCPCGVGRRPPAGAMAEGIRSTLDTPHMRSSTKTLRVAAVVKPNPQAHPCLVAAQQPHDQVKATGHATNPPPQRHPSTH
eukprot:364204-Chlamydomonas_euryale.AAC.4